MRFKSPGFANAANGRSQSRAARTPGAARRQVLPLRRPDDIAAFDIAEVTEPLAERVPDCRPLEFFYSIKKEGTPASFRLNRVFLLYQKGRDSRIFQAQDRAIDDFTLKGISAQHINRSVSSELMI